MATLTTPTFAYPYPDGAERVMDGDNAIGALANALDVTSKRALLPVACVANGPQMVGVVAATVTMTLSTFAGGKASMFDNPNDQIVIQAGDDGVYDVLASIAYTNLAIGQYARARLRINGSDQNEGCIMPGFGGSLAWAQITGIYTLVAGNTVNVNLLGVAADAADYTLSKLSVIRRGDAYGSLAELRPAEIP